MNKINKKGLTLVETMIACLILVGMIVGFLGVFNASFSLLEQLSSSVIATSDACAVLESMRNIDPFNTTNLIAVFPDGAAVAGYNNLGSETVLVNYEDLLANPIKATVSVSWQGKGGRVYTERLVTLLTRR